MRRHERAWSTRHMMASPCSARTQPAAAMRAPTRRPSGCRRAVGSSGSIVRQFIQFGEVGCTAPRVRASRARVAGANMRYS